jgi:hypothetical protein
MLQALNPLFFCDETLTVKIISKSKVDGVEAITVTGEAADTFLAQLKAL